MYDVSEAHVSLLQFTLALIATDDSVNLATSFSDFDISRKVLASIRTPSLSCTKYNYMYVVFMFTFHLMLNASH